MVRKKLGKHLNEIFDIISGEIRKSGWDKIKDGYDYWYYKWFLVKHNNLCLRVSVEDIAVWNELRILIRIEDPSTCKYTGMRVIE